MLLKIFKFIVFIAVCLLLSYILWSFFYSKNNNQPVDMPDNSKNMQIISPVFQNNEKIPSKYTCDGENINPPLQISNMPAGTKSLSLIIDDPDAPAGVWDHWMVWNISPFETMIAENSVPANAVQGRTSFGDQSYGGPCPPGGTHHYYFKLYALDTMLDLAPTSNKKALENAMQGHILAQAEMIGLYR